MPIPSLPAMGALSSDDLARVRAMCDRFEADWNAGREPLIEHEIAAADEPIRDELLRALLPLELKLTRRDGRSADLDEYLARFPDRADTVKEIFAEMAASADPEMSDTALGDQPISSPSGYEILRQLGDGGQAMTYLARDRALQRLVVLKRYHAAACSGRRQAVFNEGRALARVRSRFVATCYGVVTLGDQINLVVEYVPGRSLAELTAAERADARRCARLVEQVAGGLAEVHACGLLHRDIKPHNIILGDDGVPRLVDFGLAVAVASEALHQVAGSPPYMAPEQARGQGEWVDARTDVYGLGGVLYFLLTGKPPHAGKTRREVIEQARGVPSVPPRRIDPRVPRALERICLKATASDPQSRFQSADALRRALKRYRLFRRAAPVLAAGVILLTLLVPAWAFWPGSVRPSLDSARHANAGGGTTASQLEPKRAPQANVRVTRFEIVHFPKLDAKGFDKNRVGALGQRSFAAREDDELTVQAELSEPAYAYLIAFRADGSDDVCDPEDEAAEPPKKQQPLYPSPSKSDEKYRLTEGAGLHAFAVVVSRQPLPPYRDWKRRIGPMPWAAKLPCDPGVVWRDDGQGPVPLLDDPAGIRGKGVKARGAGEPAAKLASWLRGLPGVDAVALEAFPVEPASGP